MEVSIIVQVQVPPPNKKVIGSGRITGHTFLGWGVLEHPPAPLSCASEQRYIPTLIQCACLHSLGHDGALVKSIAINPRGTGSNLSLAATYGPWASASFAVACSA